MKKGPEKQGVRGESSNIGTKEGEMKEERIGFWGGEVREEIMDFCISVSSKKNTVSSGGQQSFIKARR